MWRVSCNWTRREVTTPKLPAAPYCPEQLGLLLGTGRHARPIGEHHLDAKQVVRCQAVLTVKRTIAAAQGQAGNTDLTAMAERRNQTVGISGRGHVLDLRPTGDGCYPRVRVHDDLPHPAQVNDESIRT